MKNSQPVFALTLGFCTLISVTHGAWMDLSLDVVKDLTGATQKAVDDFANLFFVPDRKCRFISCSKADGAVSIDEKNRQYQSLASIQQQPMPQQYPQQMLQQYPQQMPQQIYQQVPQQPQIIVAPLQPQPQQTPVVQVMPYNDQQGNVPQATFNAQGNPQGK